MQSGLSRPEPADCLTSCQAIQKLGELETEKKPASYLIFSNLFPHLLPVGTMPSGRRVRGGVLPKANLWFDPDSQDG
jgi:hypothetical protein